MRNFVEMLLGWSPLQIGVYFARLIPKQLFTSWSFANMLKLYQMLKSFDYHMAFPNDPLTLLSMIFTGHPFKRDNAILWEFIIEGFLWLIWNELNLCTFEEKETEFLQFFDHLMYTSLSWCKFTKFILWLQPYFSYCTNE